MNQPAQAPVMMDPDVALQVLGILADGELAHAQHDIDHRKKFGSLIISEDSAMERAYADAARSNRFEAAKALAAAVKPSSQKYAQEYLERMRGASQQAWDIEVKQREADKFAVQVLQDPDFRAAALKVSSDLMSILVEMPRNSKAYVGVAWLAHDASYVAAVAGLKEPPAAAFEKAQRVADGYFVAHSAVPKFAPRIAKAALGMDEALMAAKAAVRAAYPQGGQVVA